MTNFRGELLQGVVDLQNKLTSLQSKIQEKTEESKVNRRRVYKIRDEEDKYAIAAICKEEEAVEKGRLSEEAEREAQRIEREIGSVVRSAWVLLSSFFRGGVFRLQ